MTPITERLAEAYQKLDAINEIIFAAENAAMACDVVQPTIKMLSDSDIKRIFDLSLHAEYEASRTHPAEGGEGRDYVLVPREPTEAMVSAGFDVHPCRTGETKVTDAYKAMLAAAPPPQPVAPERGEAKAVASGEGSYQIGWYNTKYKAFFKMDEQDSTGRTHEMLLDGEIIRVYANATPQPPPPQPVAPEERGEAKAVTTCRICGKSSPRMTVCDSCDESSGPWGGTAVPRDLPNEPESSIHVEKPEPFTYAVVRKDVSPDFFMSRRAAEDAIAASNNRTAKIVNLYATPQPPPAPTFRDPTIEDDLRAIADDVDPNHDPMPSNHPLWDPYKQADRLRQIANAIGAKVEEK